MNRVIFAASNYSPNGTEHVQRKHVHGMLHDVLKPVDE